MEMADAHEGGTVERTQEIERPPALEATQTVNPVPASNEEADRRLQQNSAGADAPHPAPISQEETDRRLAQELQRRGVPPNEIQRLVALGHGEPPQAPARGKAAKVILPPEVPEQEPFVPQPGITLPEFRDHSVQQKTEADRLLTAANISRRRGNFADAEKQVSAALAQTPRDAYALELYGDIAQAMGRVDDAAYCYQRALEADSSRKTAEKKYAELALLQNRGIDLLRQEYIPRNRTVAVVFSALFPGAGQVYNGDALKGAAVAAIFFLCLLVLGWTNLGFRGAHSQVTATLAGLILLAGGVYIFGVIDANLSAQRGKRPKSGWEV